MKRPFLALGLAAVLTACGGGGSSSNSADANKDSIADTTSTTYTTSLKAVAEVNAATAYLSSVHDLLMFAGNSGNCAGGGTLSYAAPTQTLTLCQRNYPKNGAYTGTYTGTGDASGVSVTAINAVKVYSSGNTSQLQYTLSSGSFAGKVLASGGADVTQLTSGSVVANAGASSAYTLSALNNQITNNGTTQNVSYVNASNPTMRVAKTGGATYDVTLNQTVQIVGDNWPSSGSASIAFSTTACTPIVLTYQANNQFNVSCGGHSLTKSWTDADMVAARNAAVQ
jgi:Prokaryotic membrane lipoprotein lipid attachment site